MVERFHGHEYQDRPDKDKKAEAKRLATLQKERLAELEKRAKPFMEGLRKAATPAEFNRHYGLLVDLPYMAIDGDERPLTRREQVGKYGPELANLAKNLLAAHEPYTPEQVVNWLRLLLNLYNLDSKIALSVFYQRRRIQTYILRGINGVERESVNHPRSVNFDKRSGERLSPAGLATAETVHQFNERVRFLYRVYTLVAPAEQHWIRGFMHYLVRGQQERGATERTGGIESEFSRQDLREYLHEHLRRTGENTAAEVRALPAPQLRNLFTRYLVETNNPLLKRIRQNVRGDGTKTDAEWHKSMDKQLSFAIAALRNKKLEQRDGVYRYHFTSTDAAIPPEYRNSEWEFGAFHFDTEQDIERLEDHVVIRHIQPKRAADKKAGPRRPAVRIVVPSRLLGARMLDEGGIDDIITQAIERRVRADKAEKEVGQHNLGFEEILKEKGAKLGHLIILPRRYDDTAAVGLQTGLLMSNVLERRYGGKSGDKFISQVVFTDDPAYDVPQWIASLRRIGVKHVLCDFISHANRQGMSYGDELFTSADMIDIVYSHEARDMGITVNTLGCRGAGQLAESLHDATNKLRESQAKDPRRADYEKGLAARVTKHLTVFAQSPGHLNTRTASYLSEQEREKGRQNRIQPLSRQRKLAMDGATPQYLRLMEALLREPPVTYGQAAMEARDEGIRTHSTRGDIFIGGKLAKSEQQAESDKKERNA